MAWQFRFHPLAKEDYKAAYAWYEDQQPGLGYRFGKAIKQKLQQIADHPEAFGSRGNRKFREAGIDFFPFQIVFKIKKRNRAVFISAIHHTSRNPKRKYKK